MRRKLSLLSLLVLFLAPAFSQNVYLYAECNYTGQSYTLGVGRYSYYQMKVPNDRLSSMQIPTGMKVTIYENDNFLGRSNTYYGNISCLDASWKNMASSIVVEYDGYNQTGTQNDYITVYNDCYQRGAYQVLRPGTYTGAQLGTSKYNISSFTITGNLRVRLFAGNESAAGYSTTYENSSTCLPNNLNDKVGSLIIEYKANQYPTDPGTGGTNTTGNYATFYSDCDFNGNALRLMPGRYTGSKLGVLKNAIGSVQVPYGLKVTAYTNSDNMFGQSTQITEDITCLETNLKNRIASVVIEQGYGNNNTGNNTGNNTNPNDAVVIYVDENYRGQSATLRAGNYANMTEAGSFPDNAISSVYVPDGYRVVLYEYANFSGKSFTITASRSSFFLTSWNDKASSMVVYKDR